MLPKIESWPVEDQEALAEVARDIEARRTDVYTMTPEEVIAVAEGSAQAARGEFVSDEAKAALWQRSGA